MYVAVMWYRILVALLVNVFLIAVRTALGCCTSEVYEDDLVECTSESCRARGRNCWPVVKISPLPCLKKVLIHLQRNIKVL